MVIAFAGYTLSASTGIALGVILVMGLDEPEVGFGCWLGEGPLFPVGLVRIPASETHRLALPWSR